VSAVKSINESGSPRLRARGLGRRWVHEDDGSAPFQFIEQWTESRITEIDAARVRGENDTIQLENVQAVFQRAQRALDIGQRQCRESAEAVGTFLDQFRRQFVHAAGKIAGGGIIAHMDARRADGCYRNVDPGVIHVR
jgi:hypothetical protein